MVTLGTVNGTNFPVNGTADVRYARWQEETLHRRLKQKRVPFQRVKGRRKSRNHSIHPDEGWKNEMRP